MKCDACQGGDVCGILKKVGAFTENDLAIAQKMTINTGQPLCLSLVDSGSMDPRNLANLLTTECLKRTDKRHAAFSLAAMAELLTHRAAFEASEVIKKASALHIEPDFSKE